MKCAGVSAVTLPPTWIRSLLQILIPLVLVLVSAKDAHAYAWMIRHGYAKCNSCHTDPSGGETLSHMGRVESETLLSQPWGDNKVSDSSKFLFGVTEPDWLRAGGSLRAMSIVTPGSESKTFPMQMDAYATADFGIIQAGASIGGAKMKTVSVHGRGAQVTSNVEGWNMLSRWHWLGVELGESTLVRVGRMNLPFGVRVSEHTLWARDATMTDRESDQQHGVSIAQTFEKMRWEWMFVLGNYQISPDDFRERGYSAYFEYLFTPKLAVGVNSMILQSAKSLLTRSQSQTIRHAHGLMARYSPWEPVVLLGEADILKTSGRGIGVTGFATLDVEPFQGLHVGGTFEVLDAGKIQGADADLGYGKLQKGYWGTVTWFFFQHMDLRLDAVFRDGADKLNSSYQGQIHLYL